MIKEITGPALAIVLAGACGAAAAAQTPAAAVVGQVKFVGAVVDAPCNIDPGSVDQTVKMGGLSQASLFTGTAPKQPFDIKLTHCSFDTVKRAVVTFTGPADETTKNLSTGLAHVGIQLLGADGAAVDLGTGFPGQVLTWGNNVLHFFAQAIYSSAGATGAKLPELGDFSATSNFSISYQ